MAEWLEVSVATAPERMDALTAYLTGAEVGGLVIEDGEEFLRFLEENRAVWDYVEEGLAQQWSGLSRVKFYLPDTPDGARRLGEVQDGLCALAGRLSCPAEAFSCSASALCSADWEHNWKQYYRPMSVGERLYIVPEWERATRLPEGRTALYMNPGLIFGTGSHASTRLCLEAAQDHVRPGARVLDLGCGSGILAIAALLLGAESAAGCDLDEIAARVAAENGALNGFGPDRLEFHTGNILTDRELAEQLTRQRADLIFANIVADVIIPLSKQVGAWLSPAGVFICSGIIDTRAREVADALAANGFAVIERRDSDGWACFVCGKAQ